MNIGVFSVVYPKAAPFLEEFLAGLEGQTDQNFDVFLVNDGMPGLRSDLADRGFAATVYDASGTPAAIRKEGIRAAFELGFDWLIFLDADDFCAPERVARIRASTLGAEIAFNELVLFGTALNSPRAFLEQRQAQGALTNCMLRKANFLGLSNTAACREPVLASLDFVPDDVIAFDWALFTRLVLDGARYVFVPDSTTFYRQYDGNIAAVLDLSDDAIARGVGIKATHYTLFREAGPEYAHWATGFAELDLKLREDPEFRTRYCERVRASAPSSPLWWEPMKLPETLGL